MRQFLFPSMMTVALVLFVGRVTFAQTPPDDACSAYVETALALADAACANESRNAVCYGNVRIEPTLNTDAVRFEQAGDTVNIAEVERLQLSPLNPEADAWGVAIANVQANVPGALPGQLVTFVVFGATELTPADDNLNAFTFRGGIGNPSCSEAPDGLLVQTPDGLADVAFTVNGVEVSMGSTAYITADADSDLLFALLEGSASVTADGATEQIIGGEFTTVPLDEDAQAVGAPTEPEPIVYNGTGTVLPAVVTVNNALMPRPVEVETTTATTDLPQATAAATTAMSGPTQPRDGTWEIVADAGTTSGSSCPPTISTGTPGLAGAYSLAFSEPFSQQELFTTLGLEGAGGIAYTYTNPAENQFVATANVGNGSTIVHHLTIVSEVEITIVFTVTVSMIDCEISQFVTLTRVGD